MSLAHERLKKKAILVTGSAGRIGRAIVQKLAEMYPDCRIIGFERLEAFYAAPTEELVPVDISSDESVKQAFTHIRHFYGDHLITVIHLAAYYSFSDPSYKKYKKITVEGTKRLLKELQDFQVEQFIFTSTMLVHKKGRVGKKITERSPLKKSWSYPRSKIETEEVIHKYRGSIPTVVLRVSGVYDDWCHSIPISNQIQRIYEKQLIRFLFPGNLKAGASFMHMDDLVETIAKCVELRGELPKETTLLLGEDQVLSTDGFQKRISRLLFNKSMVTFRIPKWVAWFGAWVQCHIPFMAKPFIRPWMIKYADDNYDLDISKAKKLLHWEPKHNVSDSLETMVTHLKEDPEKWYKMNGLRAPIHIQKQWKKHKKPLTHDTHKHGKEERKHRKAA